MPVSYEIFEAQNLAYARHTGRTNLREVTGLMRDYFADPAFNPNQRHLIDLRDLEDALFTFWEMGKLKQLYTDAFDELSKPVPVAIVIGSPFVKRLVWMYSRVMKDKQTIDLVVFNEIGSALTHFDLNEDIFDTLMRDKAYRNVIDFREYRKA